MPRSRVSDARAMLVNAFDEDPYFRFLAPDADERSAFLRGVMASNIALASPRGAAGAVIAPDGELRGVSLWFSPGAHPPSALATAWAYLRHVGPHLRRLRSRTIERGLRMASLLEEAQLREPHFYLQVLAVDPRWHGRGTGSAMLRRRVAEADRARLPATLETSKEMNVRLYERFGFEVRRATRCESSPPVWTMVRAPKTGA